MTIEDHRVELCASSVTPAATLLAESSPLAARISREAIETAGTSVRSLKTAELVARTLRRMVVDGRLKEGDFLPNEAELTGLFGISRATLREAVRLLESDRLVDVRRGSRTGARVRVPGTEIIARPAGLLLEVSGATMADVMVARLCIEPMAARLLAENGKPLAIYELNSILYEEIPSAWQSGALISAMSRFHLRLVELAGNATLSMIAGMLHGITDRHTADASRKRRNIHADQYEELMVCYRHLIDLVRIGNGADAETFWRAEMHISHRVLSAGLSAIKVRDVMD
jgi:GntR family transcriptional repressor for pyruvate dehydrogenase complex